MVKRIRGTACSMRVSPEIANRIVASAKSVLLKFLPDVYIYVDHCRGSTGGKSPGIEKICIYYYNVLFDFAIYLSFIIC